jgi:hypothetical protein
MNVPIALLLAVQVAQAGVSGTVRDELSGAPLSGALVTLADLDLRILTDEEGGFHFSGLRPGPHHISFARDGFNGRTLHALVPRAGIVELNVALRPEPVELEGLLVEPRLAIRGTSVVRATDKRSESISRAAVRNHPLLPEPDVFRVLEGGEVAILPESHAGLHIRGGAASHTAYEIDGLPVLGPLHAAGLFSAWNPDAISSVRLSRETAVALPSLSGAVIGRTRSPGPQSRVYTSLSTTQARATLDGPLPGVGTGYVLSWRRGFPNSLSGSDDPAKVRGEVGDFLAKVEIPLFGGGLHLLGYGSENDLSAAAVADAPPDAAPALRNGFEWQTQMLGGTWRGAMALGRMEVRAWSSRGGGRISMPGTVGDDADNLRLERGFMATLERARANGGDVLVGVRLSSGVTRYDTGAGSDSRGGLTIGSVLLAYGGRLGAGVRARAEVDLSTSAVGLRASPTVTATADIGNQITLSAGVSRRHQFAQSLRNEESLLGTVFPADLSVSAGAPGVPVARADEVRAGVELRPLAGFNITARAYARSLESVVFVTTSTGSLFSSGAFDVGSADVTGLSIGGAMSGSHYGLVADYAYQRVRNRTSDRGYVPSYAPAHRAQLGAVYHPVPTVSVRVSQTGIWGRHATTLLGDVEWEACNLLDGGCELAGQAVHGTALGGARPGPYLRTDVGLRLHWHLGLAGRDSMLALYGTVTNLLNRANTLNFAIDPVTGESSPIEMLPVSPLVLGLELSF